MSPCHTPPAGRWREYPVTITAYSYFFGAMFMGISSQYFPATGQSDKHLSIQGEHTPGDTYTGATTEKKRKLAIQKVHLLI